MAVNVDIKLPPVGGSLITKVKLKKGIFQLTHVEKYSPDVALCETVVEAAEVAPIMLSNLSN